MLADDPLRECIVCGAEANVAAMRGMICLSCRTAAALKTDQNPLPDLSTEEATVVSGGQQAIA